MRDMAEADVGDAPFREYTLKYFEGMTRQVLVTEVETPFPDGKLIVSCTNLVGQITHANASFVEMSGHERGDLIDEYHSILRHPDMPAVAFKDLWDTVAAGKKWHGYVKNLRKDGGFYWVYATVIPNVRSGKIVGFTSVRRKPSRRKVQEAAALYKTLRDVK